ncbi:MAG: hypothetical protein HFH34_04710 [Eubacterium sp.]|nr:hypothetical protein [Eubacterium sp.]
MCSSRQTSIVFEVIDQGVRIPDELLDTLFEETAAAGHAASVRSMSGCLIWMIVKSCASVWQKSAGS